MLSNPRGEDKRYSCEYNIKYSWTKLCNNGSSKVTWNAKERGLQPAGKKEQSYGLCGRGRGWEDLGEWH